MAFMEFHLILNGKISNSFFMSDTLRIPRIKILSTSGHQVNPKDSWSQKFFSPAHYGLGCRRGTNFYKWRQRSVTDGLFLFASTWFLAIKILKREIPRNLSFDFLGSKSILSIYSIYEESKMGELGRCFDGELPHKYMFSKRRVCSIKIRFKPIIKCRFDPQIVESLRHSAKELQKIC
jgi:hypothetical protein